MTNENKFYSGKEALSYGTPFIFTMGTRSIGKTFYWTKRQINRFLKTGRKFGYVKRYKEDLKAVAEKFFDNNAYQFPDHSFDADGFSSASGGRFVIDGKVAGYGMVLNKATRLKGISMSDVDELIFDEFLPEDSIYLPDEVGKAFSLYQSVARGYGQAIRPDVRFIFIANHVTLNNPYFRELKIRDLYQPGNRYIVDPDRGWVAEFTNSEEIAKEIGSTAFGKMIAKTRYGEYAVKAQFYLDDPTFVEKPAGSGTYVCTLAWNGKDFGVYEYEDDGLLYVSHSVDKTCPTVFALTTADHKPNYMIMYKNHMNPMWQYLRYAYDNALIRFQDDECKFMFLEAMDYS